MFVFLNSTLQVLQKRFLYMYKIFQLTEQNIYLQVTYRNPIFCTYVLHKRHGLFVGAHSRIFFSFFLNSVGDTIFFISHIFGLKLDIGSKSYMTVLILLPCTLCYFYKYNCFPSGEIFLSMFQAPCYFLL